MSRLADSSILYLHTTWYYKIEELGNHFNYYPKETMVLNTRYNIWIHCANAELGDFMIPYTSYNEALAFAEIFIKAQPDYIYSVERIANGSIELGGSSSIQVSVVADSYMPVNGWDAWADAFYTITEADAMNMTESDVFNL
jgi:hypothetical protein